MRFDFFEYTDYLLGLGVLFLLFLPLIINFYLSFLLMKKKILERSYEEVIGIGSCLIIFDILTLVPFSFILFILGYVRAPLLLVYSCFILYALCYLILKVIDFRRAYQSNATYWQKRLKFYFVVSSLGVIPLLIVVFSNGVQ